MKNWSTLKTATLLRTFTPCVYATSSRPLIKIIRERIVDDPRASEITFIDSHWLILAVIAPSETFYQALDARLIASSKARAARPPQFPANINQRYREYIQNFFLPVAAIKKATVTKQAHQARAFNLRSTVTGSPSN